MKRMSEFISFQTTGCHSQHPPHPVFIYAMNDEKSQFLCDFFNCAITRKHDCERGFKSSAKYFATFRNNTIPRDSSARTVMYRWWNWNVITCSGQKLQLCAWQSEMRETEWMSKLDGCCKFEKSNENPLKCSKLASQISGQLVLTPKTLLVITLWWGRVLLVAVTQSDFREDY